MITDENNPMMRAAAQRLWERIVAVSNRNAGKLDRRTITEIGMIIEHSRKEFKRQGVELPPLTAVVLEDTGYVHLGRADMDPQGIQMTATLLAQKVILATPEELRRALYRAFPAKKRSVLDDIVDEAFAKRRLPTLMN